jgi:hypothetical protein
LGEVEEGYNTGGVAFDFHRTVTTKIRI